MDGLVGFHKAGDAAINNETLGVIIMENCSKGSLIDLLASLPK